MGIAGVSIWPLYYFNAVTSYNGRSHMFVQSDCFLYAFIVGFLWTAIPRFTGTVAPSRAIQYAAAAMLAGAAVCFEARFFAAGHTLFLLTHLIVIVVLARRFQKRQTSPPPTFILTGIGIFAGLVGGIIDAGIAWQRIDVGWDIVGRRLLTEGMVLLIVLGIGGFLGPRLLGFAQLPNLESIGRVVPPSLLLEAQFGSSFYAVGGALIVASIFVQYGFQIPAMVWIRAVIATIVIATSVQPWRFPSTRTTLSWCVWIAHWFLIAGLWIVAAEPRYQIDFLHMIFMGAFTLLILAVGTRVVLSHGGHTLTEEKKSWPIRIGVATGLVALLARLGAPFAPNSYFAHLAWAGLLWIAGIAIWGVYVMRRISEFPKAEGYHQTANLLSM